MKPSVNIIVAIDRRGAIGIGGDLVYRFKEDLRHFKTATMGSTVVMGRRTWQSLPGALPGRRNIVVSATEGFSAEGAEVAKSLEEALAMAADGPGDTYIIYRIFFFFFLNTNTSPLSLPVALRHNAFL